MSARARTMWFIAIIIIGAIFYDGYTILNNGIETSVSQVLIDWHEEYPIFGVLEGIVIGHIAWQMRKKKVKCPKCENEFLG